MNESIKENFVKQLVIRSMRYGFSYEVFRIKRSML